MLHIYHVMINLSLSLGAPLHRWTTSEVIMISNEPNNIQINRLRQIKLYEADCNLVLKFFWPHKATKLVGKLCLLGENQLGTKPLCSTEQSALMDELITDVHRNTCQNMAKLQNDATAYYDRMISNLTSLVSRSYHVPDNTCKIQATALKENEIQGDYILRNIRRILIHFHFPSNTWIEPRIWVIRHKLVFQ